MLHFNVEPAKKSLTRLIPVALEHYKHMIMNLEKELSQDIQPAREKLKKNRRGGNSAVS